MDIIYLIGVFVFFICLVTYVLIKGSFYNMYLSDESLWLVCVLLSLLWVIVAPFAICIFISYVLAKIIKKIIYKNEKSTKGHDPG